MQILRCVVNGNNRRHLEQVLRVKASPTLSGGELNAAVIFPLKLFLIEHDEVKVSNIVKNESIMMPPLELNHLAGELLEISHLQF